MQANDLLAAAADNISLNVEFNGLGGLAAAEKHSTVIGSDDGGGASSGGPAASEPTIAAIDEATTAAQPRKGKGRANDASATVRVSQGDCTAQLYAHRAEKDRFDVVDLDPYGTAAPFIDGAVQAVNDGGELSNLSS